MAESFENFELKSKLSKEISKILKNPGKSQVNLENPENLLETV